MALTGYVDNKLFWRGKSGLLGCTWSAFQCSPACGGRKGNKDESLRVLHIKSEIFSGPGRGVWSLGLEQWPEIGWAVLRSGISEDVGTWIDGYTW